MVGFLAVAVAELDAGCVVRITGNGVVTYITPTKRGEVRGIWLPIHHKVCQLVETLMLTVGNLGFRDTDAKVIHAGIQSCQPPHKG